MRSFRASAVPLGRLVGRLALCAALLTLQVGSVAWGAPSGATVVRGKVKITQKGNKTIIRASNKSIITYDSFNIAKGETVRFIQPSSKSRVLNRVLGGGPTHINGSLFANGRVYIVNRAGVRFGRGSIVDVGSLYAAAGAISNRDFLAGVDRFTDLRGSVINHGSIHAKDSIHMLGRVVANYGAVVAESGFVTMVAGDEVTLGQRDGHIHVKVSGGDPTMTAPAVINDGTIVASRKAVLGAGDLYSFAIRNTGTVKASEISVKAAQGKVEVSGTLDASDRSPEGVGGHIEVLGERVALEGATLDASGTLGGGTVEVGGGFQGSGDVTAARTFVDGDTVILSNAVSVGDGGTVVVWADELTWFFGEAQAMGGELSGDGGLIEVSGKQALVFRGDIDVRGDAPGALLLDPDTLTVVDGPGPAAQDADVADAQIFFGDPPPAFTISEAALEDLGNAATILLRANVSITIDPLTDNTLLLSSDGGGGSLAFEVGPGGTFTMDGADTINTVGVPLSITAPGGITLGGVIASDVTLVSDAVALNGTVAGTGALVVRQSTAATPIDIGDDVAGAGGMALSQVEVGLIQDGFTSIAIGNPAAGAVEINDGTGISFSDPLTVTSGVGITIGGAGLRGTDNASILLDGPGATTVLNTDVTSEGEPITFSDAVVIGAPLVAIDTTLGGNPGGAAITFESPGSIEGATPGGESLSLNGGATGFIMVSGPVGAANGLDVVTVANSGNTIFGDTFQANTVDLAATAVEIAFMGDTLIQSALTTANEGYAVRFGGLNNSVAGLTEFLNTGTVVLAQGGGFTQFVDGAETAGNTSNPLLTRIGGEVGTANGPLILGPTDLTGSSVVAATGGGVSLGDVAGGGFNLTVNSGGSATLDGAMTALGRLTLDGGGATQPGGSIAATELLLTGVGVFDLPRPANDFGVAAAAVTGPVTLTDATGLTVGAVAGTAGIDSGGGDVTVNTGNTLAIGTGLGESITATGALVTLNPSAGGVTEAAGSTITGDTLLLTGAGAFVLAQNNAVASLSGYFSGSLDYKDIDDLTVDRHQPISAQKAILSGDTNADGTAEGSGGAVTISADGTLIVARDVETTLGGGAVGGPTLTGAVVIGGPATLTEGDGEIALNGSPTGDVTIDSDTDVSVISSSRDIIIDARAFSTGGMPVELRADNNNDGDGGVWIRNGGHVDSTGAVVLEGADIFNEPGSPVSVQIDPGGMVDALTNVTIQPAAGAPAGADVILGGPVTAGGGVTVDSADRIVLGSDVSAGGTATFHDPVDLSAPSSVSGATINMNSTVGAGVHALTFSGNALNLASTVSGTGALAIEPMTPGTAVSVGDDGAAGGLLLPEATLGQLADGFSGITIGNSTAGIVEVNDAAGVTFTDPVTLGSAAGIQVNGGGLHGTGDASLTLEGPASFSANGTTEGQPIHVTGPAALAAPAVGLDTTVNANAGGSAVTFDAALDGTAPGAESLSVDGGSGGLVTFTGPVGAGIPLDTLTIANSGGATLASSLAAGTLDVQNTTGAVAVQGDTALSVGLTTIGMPYDLSFTGTTNSIAGGTVFRNTGVVTLGGGGTFAFPGGVDSATGISAPTRTDLDTAVSTVNAPIRLGPTQLLGASSLQSGTAIIRVASVDGAASDLAIQQGGTGAVTFGGTVNVGGLTTFASNYDVAFQGGTTVAADTNFLNTGALNFGLGGDTLTFAGGLDTTGGPTATNLDGILQTTNAPMDLAPVTLVGDSALRSGSGPVNVGQATGGFTLDLQDGAATGPVVFSGTVDIGGMTTGTGGYDVSLLGPTTDVGGATNFLNTAAVTLGDGGDVLTFPGGLDTGNSPTTTNLNGTVLTTNTPLALGPSALQGGSTLRSGSGAIEVESLAGPFALDLQDAAATGPATFTGDVNIAGLNTFGGAHDVALLGTTTQIAGATAFQNTGIVTFGNGGDTLTFPGGVDTSVSPSRTDVGGTVQTTNMPIAFGGTRLIGASTLDAGANTVNTFGIDGNANDLAVDAVTTTVAGGIVNVGDGAGPAIDVLSGNADFQGAITGNSGIAAQPGTVVDFANDVTLGNGDTGTTLPGTVNFGGTGTAPLDFEGFDGLAFGTLNFTTQSARLDSNAGDIGVTTLNPNSRDLTLASGIGGGQTTFVNDIALLGDNAGRALVVEAGATGRVDFQGKLQAATGLYAAGDTNVRFQDEVKLFNNGAGTDLLGRVTLTGVPGNQDFTGHNTLTFGTTTLAGAGSVTVDSHSSFTTFLRTIDDGAASVGLRVDSNPGKALFGGNINIQSLNVMTRGDIEFRSTIRTSGSTRLGLDLPDIPIVASIYKSVPGDLSFNAGTFTMGTHTKLTVVDGDLTIKASTATVSDLNASGRISVKAGTIKILLREPALVLLAGGGSEVDRGVDFVGNGGISFSGNIQLVGTGDTPQFAAVDPGTLQGVGAYKLYQLDAPVQFIRSGVALDGTTGSSDISSVLASAVSWAALLSELSSVGQGMSISPAVRELLEQLGIFARDLHPWELAEFGGGVPVGYDDIIRKILEDVVPSDHTVPITRLPGDLVDRVVVTYQSIFMKDGAYLDEEDLQALVDAALQGYRAAKKPEAIIPADFAAYLTVEPAPHAEALALLRGLALLFVEVAQLGLTAAEQDVSEGILIGGILPPGMTPGELIQTIRAVGATPQAR